MRRAWCAVLLAAVAWTVVACGDGDERGAAANSTTTSIDRAAWSEQLGAACDELNRDHDQLVSADPGSRDEAVAYAEDVEEFAVELVSVLDEAGVPSGDRADAADLADLADDLAAAAGDLATAARDGDGPAVSSATEQLRSIGDRINPLAGALDAPSCGGF